jgi:methionyl-tRNA formyltransferase
MKKYILLSEKSWHKKTFQILKTRFSHDEWVHITSRAQFTVENLKELNPDRIFIPHWSYIIPEAIYNQYECIVFHMTDLPYGRGGSPLQNLIARGFSRSKITALKVEEGLDTGPIYLKNSIELAGTAREIFLRSANVITEMIGDIIEKDPVPQEQEGEVTTFKRRKPEESNVTKLNSIEKLYDYVRMLDCEGYPNAYIETEHFKFEFSRAALQSNSDILADVRIIKK